MSKIFLLTICLSILFNSSIFANQTTVIDSILTSGIASPSINPLFEIPESGNYKYYQISVDNKSSEKIYCIIESTGGTFSFEVEGVKSDNLMVGNAHPTTHYLNFNLKVILSEEAFD